MFEGKYTSAFAFSLELTQAEGAYLIPSIVRFSFRQEHKFSFMKSKR